MFCNFTEHELLQGTLQDYIERKLSPYRLFEYAYTVINKKNPANIMFISNYPEEWAALYKENNLQHIDPVILMAFKRSSPFIWDENITLMTEIKFNKIFELSRKYNIVNGFTFVLHDHLNNIALLSFIIDKQQASCKMESVIVENMAVLQLTLIDIHEQMLKLAHSQLGRSGKVRQATSEDKPIFTPRESDVLHWASMGKTYQEIADTLNISIRTVKFHMANLVRKMGVNNARQAIRLSIELDLISRPVV